MLDAVVGMQPSRGRHLVSETVALGLTGLFLTALRCPHIADYCRQDVFSVVAQLCLAHLRAGWHDLLCEDRELDNDLFLVIADERSQRHLVVLPSVDAVVKNGRHGTH